MRIPDVLELQEVIRFLCLHRRVPIERQHIHRILNLVKQVTLILVALRLSYIVIIDLVCVANSL